MFILFVPAPPPLDAFPGHNNPSLRLAQIRDLIQKTEARIQDLEFLLTQFILDPANPVDVDGNLGGHQFPDLPNNYTTEHIRQALYQARAEEGELRTAEQAWQEAQTGNKQAGKDTQEQAKRA